MRKVRHQQKWKREKKSWRTQRVIRTHLLHGACLWSFSCVAILTARDQAALRGESVR
jgi:hypothetical protein